MPGFDGTGPRGLGPLTGGGRGFCLPGISPVPIQPEPLLRQIPMYGNAGRHGRGRGFRGGRGRFRQFY